MNYRLAEFGVERIESEASTFVAPEPSGAAWQEYESWLAAGHWPAAAIVQPSFEKVEIQPASLWIIGAGGYGREVFWLAPSCVGFERDWRVAGFLNDIPSALDGYSGLPPIVGDTDYIPKTGDVFICAIGDSAGRLRVCEKFSIRGAAFIKLISQSALISGGAMLGQGVIVEAFTGVAAHAEIGDFSTLLSHTTIGHDVKIGCGVQVSSYCDIHGWAEIGDACRIGSHAVILGKIKVGAGATIGAGSVVISDVPAGATVFGVPAKRIN